jgi:molybdate transport system permease protein
MTELLTDSEWQALALSARVAIWATLVCLPPGLFFAWLFARCHFFGKSLLEAILLLPMVLPPTVPGFLLLLLLGAQSNLGKTLSSYFGIEFVFNWKGAVLASAIIALPLMIQTIKLSFRSIDQKLEQAAATLGASPVRILLTITLPLLLPGILAGSILAFSRALGEFGATITFVGNIEGETRTLPLAIYSATHHIDGDASALRLIIISIILALGALLICNLITRKTESWLGQHHD